MVRRIIEVSEEAGRLGKSWRREEIYEGRPEYTWYVLAAHMAVGALVFLVFSRFGGGFKEQEV